MTICGQQPIWQNYFYFRSAINKKKSSYSAFANHPTVKMNMAPKIGLCLKVGELTKKNLEYLIVVILWTFIFHLSNPFFASSEAATNLIQKSIYWVEQLNIFSFYSDVIVSAMAFKITGVSMVCSNVCSGACQRRHQSSASLAFVRMIHRWPVNSAPRGPVQGKCFQLMTSSCRRS